MMRMTTTTHTRSCILIQSAVVLLCILALVTPPPSQSFSPSVIFASRSRGSSSSSSLSSSSIFDEWQEFSRAQTNLDLIDALVQPQQSLLEVFLVGQSKLPTTTSSSSNNNKNGRKDTPNTPCLVLSMNKNKNPSSSSCLFIPASTIQLKLLSFAVQDTPLSKSILLSLNPLLVNRDGALFDTLPWSTWTVDPQERNYDAASNAILPKFHLGKRDAFARFGGKDWKGRSVSIGNMALRLKYTILLQQQQDDDDDNDDDAVVVASANNVLLAKRILELQIREFQEELAGVDYELAIARTNNPDDVMSWESRRTNCLERLQVAKESFQQMAEEPTTTTTSWIASILDRIAEATTQGGQNAAPYRGAMGYAPMLDTEKDIDDGMLPFTSPFGLMREILEDQCKAKVIGSFLENTSLLDNTLTVGGAIVLQRMTAKKTITIAGEEVTLDDETVDYGSGVRGGETIIVECNVDEAIGMALEGKAPLLVEREIWDRASLEASPVVVAQDEEESGAKNVMDVLPVWEPSSQDLSFLVEGQAQNESVSEKPSSLRIPRTTTSLYDALFESKDKDSPSPSPSPSPLFPDDNPIQSLGEYDALTTSDKARTLLSLSNFAGKLPRPRVLRTQTKTDNDTNNPLDDLLLPLIDESVRRQYLIRDAEQRNDFDTVRQLEEQQSRRQVALELAQEAQDVGDEESAAEWGDEAELLASLRADVTQDEGSYSRWMDRDEWYERDRLKHSKKLDKKKFGNLLDGIE